jgi:[protein-PII] uridylyltransferase
MRGGFSEFLFCAEDQHGLYARVAGSLAAAGLNIIGSHVYTTRSGLALEVYRVTTPAGGPDEKALAWAQFETLLLEVLEGRRDLGELLRSRRRPIGRTASPARQPASVDVSNDESDFYTIVDVAADDRLGLLYDLVRTIADHGLEIYISKASTILDQAADTFYVRDETGKKLTDPERVARLQAALLAAAQGGSAGG